MSNVDDWELDEYNTIRDDENIAFGVFDSLVRPNTAIIMFREKQRYDDDFTVLATRFTVDELEALATLLLYKAKLIRENNG